MPVTIHEMKDDIALVFINGEDDENESDENDKRHSSWVVWSKYEGKKSVVVR